jgi:hypothetical protein
MMDATMTVMYVVGNVLMAGGALVMLVGFFLMICCGFESEEERAAEERRAALVAEYALARRSAAAPPAPVVVEMVRPVVPMPAAAPVVPKLGYFPYSADGGQGGVGEAGVRDLSGGVRARGDVQRGAGVPALVPQGLHRPVDEDQNYLPALQTSYRGRIRRTIGCR